jgi:HAD superfamily hydrolase (TIGR01509 family)
MSQIDLVIFDCDGVLIDSERLATRIEAEILATLGWNLSESEIVERFVGRSENYMKAEIERHIGRTVDWETDFDPKYLEVFERELEAVPGVTDALEAIDAQTCVASSSTHERLKFTLGLTGLYDRFVGRIFSATEVANGKPAPDLFLHAATQMGVPPHLCAVVEDSAAGVAGGVAAGMQVFAFAGGVTPAPRLRREGVAVFDDMRQLPGMLAAASSGS